MAKSQKSSKSSKTEMPKTNVPRTLHYYWWAIKKHKWLGLVGLVGTILTFIIRTAIIPITLANIIDAVSTSPHPDQLIAALLPSAALILVTSLIQRFILEPVRLRSIWLAEIYGVRDLEQLAFAKVNAESMQFHNDRFSGSLVSQIGRFASAYEHLGDILLWNVLPVILDISLILGIMAFKLPLYAICVAIILVLYTLCAAYWFKKLAPFNAREVQLYTKKTGQLADTISNIASVKSYAKEPHEKQRLAKYQDKYLDAIKATIKMLIKRNSFFEAIHITIYALILVLLVCGRSWLGLPVATLILVVNYSQNILGDFWNISSIFRSLNRVFGDAYEMTGILDLPDDVVDLPDAKALRIQDGAVEFSHVTFRHQDAASDVFHNFQLNIQPGERIGLVGVSGSGKTTLTKLLLRFADPTNGTILIDGQDIKHATQDSLREAIAYVPQETALFHRSIAENIAYARPKATHAEIEKAAKLANAHEFIKTLPDGYDTLVGERGVKLSGGQRQRVAIARAILKDAPILVLDEATSALDSESENLIQSALERLMKGRTSLVVAHRLSTVANLDRIIVLEKGKIKEQGTHKELLQQNGVYAKLWARQSGAFLEESDHTDLIDS